MNFKHGVCVRHLKGGCHTHFTSENHMSFVHHSRYLILFVSKYTFYLPPLYFKIYYTNIKAYFNHHGASWVFLEKKKIRNKKRLSIVCAKNLNSSFYLPPIIIIIISKKLIFISRVYIPKFWPM